MDELKDEKKEEVKDVEEKSKVVNPIEMAEKKLSELEQLQVETDHILGYGKEVEVLDGRGDDGKPKIVKYHLTPVSLGKTPELIREINAFTDSAGTGNFTDEAIDKASKIISLCLEKMHPEMNDLNVVKQKFDLRGLAKSINIAMDLNNFLSEMKGINDTMVKVKVDQK